MDDNVKKNKLCNECVVFFTAVVGISLIYLWIMASLPIRAIANAGHDDVLFLKMAARILDGQWLGPYDSLTMIKGPLYPIWIVASWVVGFPILVSQAILYAGSGILFVTALWNELRWKWCLILVFVYYLFNPVVYNLENLRVIREGLYVPLTVLVVAILAWNFRVRKSNLPTRLAWAAGLGGVLGMYWLTREEGIWILPGLAVAYLGIFLSGTRLRKDLWFPIISIVVAWCIVQAFSMINWFHYGTRDTVEFRQSEYLDAYGALTRVEQGDWMQYIPLPKASWPAIADVSTKFREILPHLDERWSFPGCKAYGITPCDGEIRGGWFMWALRQAVDSAGYYKSASTATAFYASLADEVNQACTQGKLRCLSPRSTMVPPFRQEYLLRTWSTLWHSASFVITLKGLDIKPGMSVGPVQYYISFVVDLTHSAVFPVAVQRTFLGNISLQGSGPISAKIVGQGFVSFNSIVNFHNIVQPNPNQLSADFELTTDCLVKGCFIEFFTARHMVGRFSVDDFNPDAVLQVEQGLLRVSKVFKSDTGLYLPNLTRSTVILKILKSIGKGYKALFPLLLILAIVTYGFQAIQAIWKRPVRPLFFLNGILLSLIVTRLLLISYMDVASMPAINTLYLSPVYPLTILFSCLVPLDLLNTFCQRQGKIGSPSKCGDRLMDDVES